MENEISNNDILLKDVGEWKEKCKNDWREEEERF